MALDTSPGNESREEPEQASVPDVSMTDAERGPFTLASLLDLNDAELAQPLSRVAPPEHRWEQLSFGVTSNETPADAPELRTGAASQPPASEPELIPGLDAPGAVEVPVYLAGRTLQHLLDTSTAAPDALDDATGGTTDDGKPVEWALQDLAPEPEARADALTPAVAAAPTDSASHTKKPDVVVAAPEPLAIAAPILGRQRSPLGAPEANFEKADDQPVLWPKRKTPVARRALQLECARCGHPTQSDICERCGHESVIPSRSTGDGAWQSLLSAFLDSDSPAIRTIGALLLAPGELTRAALAGDRKRYYSPVIVATAALLLFAIVSALGGLRPRPDRAITIGAERSAEVLPGLVDATPVNLAVEAPPDLLRDVATTIDYVPLLWLPLMAFLVVAIIASTRAFQHRDDRAEFIFAAHFSAAFVLWWGVVLPLLLLVTRFGFESAAAWDGVTHIRYLPGGQIEGLSPAWNDLRAVVVSPTFHTAALAVGLVPSAIMAYRRAFDASWGRAIVGGALVAAVPLVLLTPFA